MSGCARKSTSTISDSPHAWVRGWVLDGGSRGVTGMKTCFNTITAGPEAPLEEIIAACGRNGFKGLEIEHNHLVGCLQRMPVAQVAHLLAEYRLAPASLMAFNLEVF